MIPVEMPRDPGKVPVCVVIPNRNYAPFLSQAIGSVVAQSHAPLDLIIYDDGSDDDSVDIAIAAIRANRARFRVAQLVVDPVNRGKLYALNHCLPLISAPVVSILDADDWLEPGFLHATVTKLVEAHRDDPRVAFVYTDCTLVSDDGRPICRGTSRPFDAALLEMSSYIPDCAPVLTERLVTTLPYDISIRVATKHHKWLRLVRAGNAGVHLPEPLFSYRMHDRNLSGIGDRISTDMRTGARREAILERYWAMASNA